ncbi:ComEC/Rec2 family competence protein [Consotaella aegiceratis]|uniref:ComEC/Rec2 family competence protein n=1 Tax=Consotaella aegiceratis TaxID=3097961 RepID=UPI002F4237A7
MSTADRDLYASSTARRRNVRAGWVDAVGGHDDAEATADPGWWARAMAIEEAARSSFALAPIGLIVGVVLVHGLAWRWPPLLALGLAVPCLASLRWTSGAPLRSGLALVVGFALLGVALAQWELQRTETTILSGDVTTRIEGTVVWRDQDERGRMRYRIRLADTQRPHLSRPPEEVRILVTSRHGFLPLGSTYRGLVRLMPPSGPAYPGGYDFAFSPYFEGLGAYGFSLGAPEPASDTLQSNLSLQLMRLHLGIAERIRSVLPGATGGVAAALVTGERSGIPDTVTEWLRKSGLAHLLAISGLHMALAAGFAMTLVRALLAAIPGLALRFPVKKWAAAAAIVVAAAYLAISGANVATQRAFIMLGVMLLAILFDRPALTLRNVAIAALIVIALGPHAVMTASFQMSFAATTALVGAYGGFARWRAARSSRSRGPLPLWRKLILFFVGIAASSLIASVATAPYAAYNFQRLAPFGLVANLLALPIFSLWVMPLALLSVLAMPFGLDAPFLHLLAIGLDAIFAIAHLTADHMPDAASGIVSPLALAVLTAALLVATLCASRLRWIAVPLAGIGLALALATGSPPELLIFEDGEEVALIAEDGTVSFRKERPNGFVADQWLRAYGGGTATADTGSPFDCEEAFCRAVSRSGLTIVWTDDYELTGRACDEADVAIVARAIRLDACRSGALLVTLRTLRRTGSLAISRSPATGRAEMQTAIGPVPAEWNAHRLAPWPEYWRKPEIADGEAGKSED